jgi:hypothetical protein
VRVPAVGASSPLTQTLSPSGGEGDDGGRPWPVAPKNLPQKAPGVGEETGGGKATPVCTPTPTLPHRGGGERGPGGGGASVALQAFAEMWVKRSPLEEGQGEGDRM